MVLLVAKLTTEDGTPLQNKPIKFYAASDLISVEYTDSNGEARTTHTPAVATKYKAVFEGDDLYEPSYAEAEYNVQQCQPIFRTGVQPLDQVLFCIGQTGITASVAIIGFLFLLILLRR